MTIKIEVYKKDKLEKTEVFTLGAIRIGRSSSSHLQLDGRSVSESHAVIEIGETVQAIDLASATGTFLNGKKVSSRALSGGDVLRIGPYELRVSFVAASESISRAASKAAIPKIPAAAISSKQVAAPAVAPQTIGGAPAPTAPTFSGESANAPAFVDLNAIEDITQEAVEVVVMWNGSVLQVEHYSPNDKKPVNFQIGEAPECNFPIPAESIGGQTRLPLVTTTGGCGTVTIIPGMSGDVTIEDGTRVPFADMIAGGKALPSPEIDGAYAFALPARGRVKLDFESWTFLVNSVPSPKKFVAPMQMDWSSQVYTGFSLLAHAVFLFLIYFVPPNSEVLTSDALDDNSKFITYMLSATEVKQDEIPDFLKEEKMDEPAGGKGKRHKLTEGKMGKRDAKDTKGHFGIKGPRDQKDLQMARNDAKKMATTAGILSYLSAANQPTSPFGGDVARGADPENALGGLLGTHFGDSHGWGGLGITGTGRGGGGDGEGTIGLGSLDTIGRGGGGGEGVGYGGGAGGLSGRRPPRGPRIRGGVSTVKGSLSKDVIRRVVRRHLNEVKFCYEKQLSKRPDLTGRVTVRFIISGNGAVQGAAVDETSLGDPIVEQCIAQAVRRWSFPSPEDGGIVIVRYPFLLASQNN